MDFLGILRCPALIWNQNCHLRTLKVLTQEEVDSRNILLVILINLDSQTSKLL